MDSSFEPTDDVFSKEILGNELREELLAYKFSPSELQALCKVPCRVRLNHRNVYYSLEKKVVEMLNRTNKPLERRQEYTLKILNNKFNHYYSKFLKWQEDYKGRLNGIRSNRKLGSILYIENLREAEEEEIIDESERLASSSQLSKHTNYSLQIQYTPGTEEFLKTPAARAKTVLSSEDIEDFQEFAHAGIVVGSDAITDTQPTNNMPSQQTYSGFTGGLDKRLQSSQVTSTQEYVAA
ncbi:unnamed protein product [Hermetia illucens]|uniref:Uncharacterized protein n=1 Tax=Hermetia illucens TaxID=343691 RepID=A0A7R8UNH4_HERIL|nr:uncharacterized protein LOC119651518 [Hermetia illucens]XP_037911077.1 uncharacterized protein LOC119651518 [Hermetia illucens]CAD7084074.1 unnamed protein product [Hermetia illucens]